MKGAIRTTDVRDSVREWRMYKIGASSCLQVALDGSVEGMAAWHRRLVL